MTFVAFGLNHKTAPLEIREKFAVSAMQQNSLLPRLMDMTSIREATILHTCNRTEFYCDTDAPEQLIPWLANEHNVLPQDYAPYFYLHRDFEGMRHTLRVASGLDSMMLGEPQILGQMKQAYQQAYRAGAVKTNLRHFFEYVFSASKRIRNRSGIGNTPVSVAYAGVRLISQVFTDFEPLKVFLIGSGETAELVATYLHKAGVKQFFVASRTQENAQQLASNFSAKALTIGDIPQYLSQADIVVSATACPLPFISKSLVEHALQNRRNAPMFFLDLAVPRDIEANVAELPAVSLYNIDDLQNLSDAGMEERRFAAIEAEQLVECELDNYIRQHRSLRANNTICNYRDHMQQIAQNELQRALDKLHTADCQQSVLTEFCNRLVNKLLHHPTTALRKVATDNREDLFDFVHYLLPSTSITQQNHEEIS